MNQAINQLFLIARAIKSNDESEESIFIPQIEEFLNNFEYEGIDYDTTLNDEYMVDDNVVTIGFQIENDRVLNGDIVFDCKTNYLIVKIVLGNKKYEKSFMNFDSDKIETFIVDSFEEIEAIIS